MKIGEREIKKYSLAIIQNQKDLNWSPKIKIRWY